MTAPLQLPVPLPTASGWQLYDFRTVSLNTPPCPGNGRAVVNGQQLGTNELWLIDHAVISSTTVNGQTKLRLYEDRETPSAFLDGSDTGNFDVADWPAGLLLNPGTSLLAVWTGADPGAIGTLRLQVRVLRNGGV